MRLLKLITIMLDYNNTMTQQTFTYQKFMDNLELDLNQMVPETMSKSLNTNKQLYSPLTDVV